MNKKNLSVVMAGAMLATSVAPVLADTTEVKKYEVSKEQLGLLRNALNNLFESKKFVDSDYNQNLRGKSVYSLTTSNAITGANIDASSNYKNVTGTITNTLSAGTTVYIWEDGYREVNGKYYSTSDGTVVGSGSTFTKDDLTSGYNTLNTNKGSLIKSLTQNATTKEISVVLNAVDVTTGENISFKFAEGDAKVDFSKVVSKDGLTYDISKVVAANATANADQVKVSDVVGFAKAGDTIADGKDIPAKLVAEIKITSDAGNNLLVSDLYDGTMLTEKGYEILNALKEVETSDYEITVFGAADDPATAAGTALTETEASNTANNASALVANTTTGIVTFKIKYTDAYGEKYEYTVRGTASELNAARKTAAWLASRNPQVDVVGGQNRYETAVEIAKKSGVLKATTTTNNKIVLVNGEALVDGLAASPYAKALGGAPILLSETDSLPKATKDYLKELTENITSAQMENIEIHLVGGEAVLSNNLKKELKDMGFTVKRIAGDDREETSIAVSKAIKTIDSSIADAFVVGANGEADAMSVASVSADTTVNNTGKIMPIIVSSVHGLSEDAMEYLKDSNVTVVGGTAQISNEEYKALNEANGNNTVTRIAGANRQATNAAVIKTYYSSTTVNNKPLLVAKDGQKNKSELVDALAASTLASKLGSPIVLATTKLSNEQINEIELSTSSSAKAVYQLGKGVSSDVIKTLVKKFGL